MTYEWQANRTVEIKQLEIFVAMAHNLSFSKTAEVMYLSQPTVSVNISALEKSLGVQLFVRNTKEVSMTKAGLALLVHAKKILAIRDQVLEDARADDQNLSGSIDLIASTIPAQHLLPEIIADFRRQWPNVVFRVDQADSRQVERGMLGFRYDFGMVGTLPAEDRFVHFPIFEDELVLACPCDMSLNPAAIRAHFADYVRANPFIMREQGSGTRTEIESLLQKLGVSVRELRVPAYLSDAHSILLGVSRGLGISLVSANAAALYVQAGLVQTVEMQDPLFLRQIRLLYNKQIRLSPLQQAFAEHARCFYGSANGM